VQFAILLLPMLLLILGTFDTGYALLTETRITFAVEAAAKCGAVNTTLCGSPTATACLRRVNSGSAGPRRIGICRHDRGVWDQRYRKLPVRWCSPAGRHTESRGLLSDWMTLVTSRSVAHDRHAGRSLTPNERSLSLPILCLRVAGRLLLQG
jgi:hypothetical protein